MPSASSSVSALITFKVYDTEEESFALLQNFQTGDARAVTYDFELADMNCDGYLDLVAAWVNEGNCDCGVRCFLWRPAFDEFATNTYRDLDLTGSSISPEKIVLGKIPDSNGDYDGYPDLLVADAYNIYMYENENDDFAATTSWESDAYNFTGTDYLILTSMKFADLEGEGGQSLIVAGYRGVVGGPDGHLLTYIFDGDPASSPLNA